MAEKQFYQIKAQAGAEVADIFIYEEIGENWYGEGTTAKNFCRELKALDVKQINLRINSPGGSVFDGQAIYNAVKRHPANVTVYIDGVAASIASVIALAGDKVVMASNALFMIHNPWGFAMGNSEEMRKYADLLDKVRDTILSVYKEKCGKDDDQLIADMDAETWMNAEEAVAYGFVDEIGIESKMAASARRFDLKSLGYRNAPQIAAGMATPGCHDNPDMYAQMPCEKCDMSADCCNPNCTANETSAASAATIQAPKANIKQEVVTMSNANVATPAAGGERNFQAEAVEIITMCQQSGCADRAAGFIQAGLTPNAAGRQILDLFASGAIATPASEALPIVDMGRDGKKYSYAKAIAAAVEMREGRQASGFEVEIHQELSKKLPQNYATKGGILVPQRVQNAVLTTGGNNTGKEAVFQEYGEFIDILRNMMATTRMGAKILTGLQGPITFPKQTGAATLYWTGENPGQDVAQSNITFGTVTMSPKTCQAQGALSRQLIIQSTPDVEGIVRNDLAMIHALGWDLAALHGTGQNNQPTGLYSLAGVNAIAMGGVPTFGKLVDMVTKVATYNALFGTTGFLTNPQMAGKLMQTLDFPAQNTGRPIWQGKHTEGVVAGYDAIASNQVSAELGVGSDEIGILFGNWADLLIGMWGALEILVDPYTLAGQGLLKITSFQMADVAARRGESFTKSTGAKLA